MLKDQIRKSRRKFDAADQDKDGKMNREEYVLFQHPEEAEYMEKIAIEEIVDEVDRDGDRLEKRLCCWKVDRQLLIRNRIQHYIFLPILNF